MHRRVTINQLAEACGLAKSTVSIALREPESEIAAIRPDTRRRVLETAQKLGYRPSYRGRALAANRSHCVGLIYARECYFQGDFYQRVLSSCSAHLTARDYDLMLVPAVGDQDRWAPRLLDQRVDGCLVVQPMPEGLEGVLRTERLPGVLINLDADVDLPQIRLDHRQALRLLFDHLVDLGHRHIAFAALHDSLHASKHYSDHEQREAYHEARSTLTPDRPAHFLESSDPGDLMEQVQGAIDDGVTAVICKTDEAAMKVIRGLRDRGLVVPTDVSVVGSNDSLASADFIPAITTTRPPLDDLARLAVESLIDVLDGGLKIDRRVTTLSWSLIQRESTSPPTATR